MSQSLSNVILHVVFSTKSRQRYIDTNIEEELFKYLATVCKSLKCPAHRIGGADDHVHIACTLARTVAISELVQQMKQDSSAWIKEKGQRYRSFAWQNGYGAFSIGQSQLADSSTTSQTNENTTRERRFRMSSAEYWSGTRLSLKRSTCGISALFQSLLGRTIVFPGLRPGLS